jgi:sterol 3beta-glucosyltransferase
LYFETKFPLIDTVKKIATQLRQRIVVVKGWGINDTRELAEHADIRVISSAPYDKLLPQVRAVIHHGGIGTTVACLYSEKPFLPCPVLYPLGDQFFWSTLSFKHGFALKPVPLKKMTTALMLTNVEQLLNNDMLYVKAATFGKKLKTENGVSKACELIEQLHPQY